MDILGLALSYMYVFMVLAGSLAAMRRFELDSFNTRKLVHISVSNWWFFLLAFFTRIEYALIGPVSFIILNAASYRFHLFPSMELDDNRKNLGTIYFPVSLLVLVLLGYGGIVPLTVGGIGILVLGYGDGLAALLGKRFGTRTFRIGDGTKSLIGTSVMFFVSLTVVLAMTYLWQIEPGLTFPEVLLTSVLTAAAAALIELATPWGIDNITIPVGTALIYQALAVLMRG